MKKRIQIALPLLFLAYLLAFHFGIEPHSETNWITYGLTHEMRLFLLPISFLMMFVCIKNWRWVVTWIGIFGLGVVFIGHPNFGSRPEPFGDTIKILTYNVANFEVDKAAVMKVIKESDADIICLQEACKIGTVKAAGAALSRELHGYYWTGASTNMILSRYPLSDQQSLNVPTKWPTKEFPSAVVETPIGRIRVMSVHLEPSWIAGWPPAFDNTIATLSKVCQDRRRRAT